MEVLDLLYKYAGPCAFCGYHDKRHRLADSIIENVRGGDSILNVAQAYEVSEETVAALVAYADERRRKRKARWPEAK